MLEVTQSSFLDHLALVLSNIPDVTKKFRNGKTASEHYHRIFLRWLATVSNTFQDVDYNWSL